MEGLMTRAYIAGALLLVAGIAINISAVTVKRPSKTEEWMEQKAPTKVGKFIFLPGTENPAQSYRMDDRTYELLVPYGIVCRLYLDAAKGFDMVLIASQSRASFHDPRVCFAGQGWVLSKQHTENVETKTRGKVPITITEMDGARRGQLAAFFYRGPGGFYPSTNGVKWDMFKQELFGSKDVDGVFYRVIPRHADCTVEELKQFIAEYLDTAYDTSDGYF
ncbi:MAG: exosortase-associated EpsI family protein [Armatimonadetes bacterium]|nr:MAG: exosortase-associated EpsI family protein [Armatimonadota bacterium]